RKHRDDQLGGEFLNRSLECGIREAQRHPVGKACKSPAPFQLMEVKAVIERGGLNETPEHPVAGCALSSAHQRERVECACVDTTRPKAFGAGIGERVVTLS